MDPYRLSSEGGLCRTKARTGQVSKVSPSPERPEVLARLSPADPPTNSSGQPGLISGLPASWCLSIAGCMSAGSMQRTVVGCVSTATKSARAPKSSGNNACCSEECHCDCRHLLPEKANFLLKFEYDDQSVVSRIKLKTLIETCCASKQIKAAMLNGKMGNDAGVPPSRQIRCALRRLQQACAVAGRSAKSREVKWGPA